MVEAKFSRSLRAKLPGITFRIENAVCPGMPDVVWLYKGRTIWIETKCGAGATKLRPTQVVWATLAESKGSVLPLVLHCKKNKIVGYWGVPGSDNPFTFTITGKRHAERINILVGKLIIINIDGGRGW